MIVVFSELISIMCNTYLLLLAFHLVGLFFNIRMFASCFKDKAKYTILQKTKPFMLCQCIIQVAFLALNANEATTTFEKEHHGSKEWCGTNSVLMTSVGFLMIYNVLAMLAIEHHAMVGLRREPSPKVALLMFGILSFGTVLSITTFSVTELCASYTTLAVASSLLMFVILWVLWRVCTYVDHETPKISTETFSLLYVLSKNKTVLFSSTLIVLAVVLKIILDVVSSVAFNYQEVEDEFKSVQFFEKVLFLYIICFVAGISLPLHFQNLIDFIPKEANEKAILV